MKGFPAIKDKDMERNIDELLMIDHG